MDSLLRKPSAWIPIAMSFTALVFVVGYVSLFGIVQHEDEGTPARLFQLIMIAETFIILFFAIKWLPRIPKETLRVLALQIVTALIPILLVIFLER